MTITQPSWEILAQKKLYGHLNHLHIMLRLERKPLFRLPRAAIAILLHFWAVFCCFFGHFEFEKIFV